MRARLFSVALLLVSSTLLASGATEQREDVNEPSVQEHSPEEIVDAAAEKESTGEVDSAVDEVDVKEPLKQEVAPEKYVSEQADKVENNQAGQDDNEPDASSQVVNEKNDQNS